MKTTDDKEICEELRGCISRKSFTFSVPVRVCLLQNFHGIWATASGLTVPEKETLGTDVFVN